MKQTRFYMTETTLVQNHGGMTAWVVREPNGGIDSAYIIEDLARDRVATLNSTTPKGEPMSDTLPYRKFLADSGYDTIEEWAHDSDYVLETDGDWYQVDNPGFPVSIIDCIHDAMDACGWVDPSDERQTCILTAENIDTEDDCTTHDHEPDESSTMAIHLRFHTKAQRAAFSAAITGHDDDVLLAAERTINDRLDINNVTEHGIWIVMGSAL